MSSTISLPARKVGPLGSISIRVGIAVACLAITTVLVYVERAGYRDSNGTPISWLDALYYATVTLSTTGYGDIVPVTEQARLANVLIITPLRFLFLIVLVGTTIEVLTQRSRDEYRAKRWRQRVQGHTVVIGYGVKGRGAVTALIEQGVAPHDIVVVAHDIHEVHAANALGCVGVTGDATREGVLREAMVQGARQVVVAAVRDATTVLIVLTARRLAPTAQIVASARESQNSTVIKQSGADIVIPTAESAGRMLALSLTSPVAGSVVEDLLESRRGLEIVERDVLEHEVGASPESLARDHVLVLAIMRDGTSHRFDSGAVTSLSAGDRLVVIRASGA